MSAVLETRSRYQDLVARAIRILNSEDVMDYNGHASARDASDANVIWINNRLASRSSLTAADVVPYDLRAGKRIGEGPEPPSEIFIHREIYLRRPDVQGIVHSHPHHILQLSAAKQTLRPIASLGSFLPEAGAALFDSTVLINTEQRGIAMAKALGDGPLVVLRQHGAVAVGESLQEAVVRHIGAELNAIVQFGALQIGDPNYLAGGELQTLHAENWGAHATRKAWHYYEETAYRRGALEGLPAPTGP